MADATINLVIRQLTVDTVTWTPFVVPFDCSEIAWFNSGSADLKFRSDSGAAGTEKKLGAGSVPTQELIGPGRTSAYFDGAQGPRFPAGTTIGFFQAVSGTGPVVFTLVK
jgi:hypothetical protein